MWWAAVGLSQDPLASDIAMRRCLLLLPTVVVSPHGAASPGRRHRSRRGKAGGRPTPVGPTTHEGFDALRQRPGQTKATGARVEPRLLKGLAPEPSPDDARASTDADPSDPRDPDAGTEAVACSSCAGPGTPMRVRRAVTCRIAAAIAC
jgi:hypothetical protein